LSIEYSLTIQNAYDFQYKGSIIYTSNAPNDYDLVITEIPYITINGEQTSGETPESYSCELPFYIFGMNKYGSVYKIANMKLYYIKIWDNGTLVRDFIPVLDENNVACLYDKVSGTYYYNAGTDDFVAGDPILSPIITVNTPTRTKISRVEGYDQSVVTFTSDMDLQAWEARATIPGVTPARGVGLLVESGTTLSANTEATIYIDDEELTNGDNEYTITVYGQSTGGEWSE
jgi:hypothetical protein